jgi:DNA-binding NarL/FixJ family response regulator
MKIMLVDDHRMVRDGLRAILEKEGIQVVAEASNGHEALALTSRTKPEIVIMDISMPDLNGIDATRRLLEDFPTTKVIALSMHADRRYVIAMFEAGAVGYLLKNSAASELLQAVAAVAEGLTYISPAVAGTVLTSLGHEPVPAGSEKPLSVREREVLQLVAEGKSSKEIANQLGLAVATVETHRRQIMDKLNLRTIAELTKHAVREGLTTLD